MRIDAGADLGIRPVAAGKGDIDQHLAGTGFGLGHIRHDKLFRCARRVNDDGFHCCLLKSWPTKMRRSAGEERSIYQVMATSGNMQSRSIMKTIGVDVGGTFTDIVYCDLDTGQVAIHKVSTTPDDPSRAIIQGIAEICRDNGIEAGRYRLRAARHHHRDQRRAGAQGRARGHADQRRFPRHHPHRAAPARRALLDHAGIAVAEPAAGQAASPQGGEGQARAAARRRNWSRSTRPA